MAQGFSQRPRIDFDQTYSPVMDTTFFRFLLAFTVQLLLHIWLLDVVIAYLYGILDTTLFFLPPLGFLPLIPSLPLVGALAFEYIRHYMALNSRSYLVPSPMQLFDF